jgi:hypothetical protein
LNKELEDELSSNKETPEAPETPAPEAKLEETPNNDSDLPDWLKSSPALAPQEEETFAPETPEAPETPAPEAKLEETPNNDSDLPDWLKSSPTPAPQEETIVEETPEIEDSPDELSETQEPKSVKKALQPKQSPKKPANKQIKKEEDILKASTDDLPDWLK